MMKRKQVIIAPKESWQIRKLLPRNKKFPRIVHKYSSAAEYGFHTETNAPADILLFDEIYEDNKPHPSKLCYRIFGNTKLLDLTEYEDNVTTVDFAGHICSIKGTFEVIKRLPNCKKVTYTLGEEEQRQFPRISNDDQNPVLDVNPIGHVTSFGVVFKSQGKDKDKKFLPVVQEQIKIILRLAHYNFPNLEDIKIDGLPGAEATYKCVKGHLPFWKRLKHNYDLQITQDIVKLVELSHKASEIREPHENTPAVSVPEEKQMEETKNKSLTDNKLIAEKLSEKQKKLNGSLSPPRPIVIHIERVTADRNQCQENDLEKTHTPEEEESMEKVEKHGPRKYHYRKHHQYDDPHLADEINYKRPCSTSDPYTKRSKLDDKPEHVEKSTSGALDDPRHSHTVLDCVKLSRGKDRTMVPYKAGHCLPNDDPWENESDEEYDKLDANGGKEGYEHECSEYDENDETQGGYVKYHDGYDYKDGKYGKKSHPYDYPAVGDIKTDVKLNPIYPDESFFKQFTRREKEKSSILEELVFPMEDGNIQLHLVYRRPRSTARLTE